MDSIKLLNILINKRLLLVKNLVKNQNCIEEIKPYKFAKIKIFYPYIRNNGNLDVCFDLEYFDEQQNKNIKQEFDELEKLEFELIGRGLYQYDIELPK